MKKNNRATSRKFIVFLCWLIILIVNIVVTKTIDANIVSWFGAISIIYIGGNVFQKYIDKK